jgi:hypothetical protein
MRNKNGVSFWKTVSLKNLEPGNFPIERLTFEIP